MECIIKIKGKDSWLNFTSEEEARRWLANNHAEQEGNSINTVSQQDAALKIIKAADDASWNYTKKTKEKMTTQLGDFDYENYSKESEAVSLGEILKEIRVPDPTNPNAEKRLFPEFITSN